MPCYAGVGGNACEGLAQNQKQQSVCPVLSAAAQEAAKHLCARPGRLVSLRHHCHGNALSGQYSGVCIIMRVWLMQCTRLLTRAMLSHTAGRPLSPLHGSTTKSRVTGKREPIKPTGGTTSYKIFIPIHFCVVRSTGASTTNKRLSGRVAIGSTSAGAGKPSAMYLRRGSRSEVRRSGSSMTRNAACGHAVQQAPFQGVQAERRRLAPAAEMKRHCAVSARQSSKDRPSKRTMDQAHVRRQKMLQSYTQGEREVRLPHRTLHDLPHAFHNPTYPPPLWLVVAGNLTHPTTSATTSTAWHCVFKQSKSHSTGFTPF